MSRILAWCLIAASLACPAALRAEELHGWKFKVDDRFFADWTFLKLERLRQVAQLTEGVEELRIVCRFTVLKTEPKRVVLEQQFLHIDARRMGNIGTVGTQLFKGALLQVTLGKDLQVERIEGLEALVGVQPDDKLLPQQKSALEGMENLVRHWLQQVFIPINGDEWTLKAHRENAICGWEKTYHQIRESFGNPTRAPIRVCRFHTAKAKPYFCNEEIEKKKLKDLVFTAQDYEERGSFDCIKERVSYVESRSHHGITGSLQVFPGKKSAQIQTETTLHTKVQLSDKNPLEVQEPSGILSVSMTDKFNQLSPLPMIKNSLGMKLMLVSPGFCTVGVKNYGQQDGDQTIEVAITRPIHMAAHEVTIGQYRKFALETGYKTEAERRGKAVGFDKTSGKMGVGKYSWRHPGWDVDDNHPAVNLSWEDAKEFCLWLSKKEGKNYRLPTEAEWEYACRAGTKTAYSCGDEPETLAKFGNVADVAAKKVFPQWQAHRGDDGHVFTSPVGSYKPNALGLYDMHGNALEWCEDWYFHYPRRNGEVLRDPQGAPVGLTKVQRGGSFADFPQQCTSAYRVGFPAEAYCVSSGFRVVLADGPVTSFARAPSWVGQAVMPRDPDILSNFSKDNFRPTPDPVMTVEQEHFGLCRVLLNGADVVLPKEDLLPIDKAMAIYSERLTETVLPHLYYLRSAGHQHLGNHKEALNDLAEALKLDDENPWLYMTRATLHQQAGKYALAVKDLRKAVELKDENSYIQNAIAWLLATCPDAKVRDGKKAVEHGERARELTKGRDGNILDTLAAAYAEDGQFEEAIRWQNASLRDVNFAASYGALARERLKLYESNQAYREP